MLKTVLLAISLTSVLVGCGKDVPEFPEVAQCAYSIKFDKWRCKNTKTGEAFNLRRDDPKMEGAQALSASDYVKSERWIDVVIAIARKRCQ